MKPIPYVLIKCATSLDGYLDDMTDKRLILSNKKDFTEVEKIRESCDAILVGAQTIRKDNPRLVLKSGKKLTKVTITQSGNLDPKSNFFTMGESRKIVYTTPHVAEKLKKEIPNATIVSFDATSNLRAMLEDLYNRGVRRLLVEGGSTIITEFLSANLVDELQISVAPITLGDSGRARLMKEEMTKHLHLQSEKRLDDMTILIYKKQLNNKPMKQSNDSTWIEHVVQLSKNCPPSDTAFAVGAALVDNDDNLIGNGYSREVDPNMHAEEVIFEKLKNQNVDFSNTTLYTSLEPCNTRQSKATSCVDLILKHGINRIVYAATEPVVFADANGAKRLKEKGKEVIKFPGYEDEVMKMQSPAIQNKWKQ